MATTMLPRPTSTADTVPAGHQARSPWMVGFATFAAVSAVVFVLTALLVALAPIGTGAVLGTAAFLTFWLGGGFGVIAGSAVVFGREH